MKMTVYVPHLQNARASIHIGRLRDLVKEGEDDSTPVQRHRANI
jgi:hypothetical protein